MIAKSCRFKFSSVPINTRKKYQHLWSNADWREQLKERSSVFDETDDEIEKRRYIVEILALQFYTESKISVKAANPFLTVLTVNQSFKSLTSADTEYWSPKIDNWDHKSTLLKIKLVSPKLSCSYFNLFQNQFSRGNFGL